MPEEFSLSLQRELRHLEERATFLEGELKTLILLVKELRHLEERVVFLEGELKTLILLVKSLLGNGTKKAKSGVLFFINAKGEMKMDLTVQLADTPLRAFLAEFDGPNGTGNPVPGIGPTTYSSSDPTVATVDPVSGFLKYLKAGVTTITGLNSGNQITASGVLSVISGIAQSGTLQFLSQASATAAR
jgi:hypothetical protein